MFLSKSERVTPSDLREIAVQSFCNFWQILQNLAKTGSQQSNERVYFGYHMADDRELSKEENGLKTQQNIAFLSHYLAVILRVSDFICFENIVILVPCCSDIALTQNVQNVVFEHQFYQKSVIIDNKVRFPIALTKFGFRKLAQIINSTLQ